MQQLGSWPVQPQYHCLPRRLCYRRHFQRLQSSGLLDVQRHIHRNSSPLHLRTIRFDVMECRCRLYVGNMAVAPSSRRQGVASSLLSACERLGTRSPSASVYNKHAYTLW